MCRLCRICLILPSFNLMRRKSCVCCIEPDRTQNSVFIIYFPLMFEVRSDDLTNPQWITLVLLPWFWNSWLVSSSLHVTLVIINCFNQLCMSVCDVIAHMQFLHNKFSAIRMFIVTSKHELLLAEFLTFFRRKRYQSSCEFIFQFFFI